MKKFSLAMFVVVLVLVNGDSPAITETHLEIIGRTEEPEEVQSSAEELKNLCECFRRSEPPSTCPFRVRFAVPSLTVQIENYRLSTTYLLLMIKT